MLGAIGAMIGLGVATAATVYGYFQARIYTRKRLAFVDAAQSTGAGTAVLFGIGVGAGVAGGQSDIKHRRLNA